MGNYSYKDVVYGIPDKYIKMVEKENGREYDDDPGYDGDCWSATAYWINGLEARIAELDRSESWARDCCSALERENEQLRMALQSITPQVIDWVKCGAVTNGRSDNEWRTVVESLRRAAALLKEDNQ